ncbi:asparagine synthase (glutamine-hydrolyzing) [Shimazuella sp. AN120528]|uniref:asparagine synthase (glutamine-hydrolyzing) n=1 Tax=Shimazuella soli TaxID=1892854 RepID=UPI001F112A0B|nr:asparagine synthase (glutamine-hydrolyzing) [Shimazuella soli]MCH5584828.1 asparagine synthase (glutamine-hydrolyzing) [Shimazuella soli]
MCGITGWVDWNTDLNQQKDILQAMADTLECRGPDAEGIWLSTNAAFAHRRLAIIDLEGGSQPMIANKTEENDYVITYSGEIYNYIELTKELKSRGHSFKTQSDTEVLLRSYIEWGASCVEHLNGIFAFGIWDKNKQELFLARDRLGVKPLFYAIRDGAIVFGSELKALLANPLVQPIVDREGLSEIFALFPIRTPGHGIFKDVKEIRPGYTLRFNRDGSHPTQYWKLESHPHQDDPETTAMKIRELLYDIVQRQLISDVPICTLLSGGLDSSSITALSAEILNRQKKGKVQTFSVDYQDSEKHFQATPAHPSLDSPWVKKVVDHVDTNHHNIVLDTPDLIENFLVPLRARDLPSMGDIDMSLYLLFKELKKYATVALSGESADEVFGGYPWFHSKISLDANTFPWIPFTQSKNISIEGILSKEWADKIHPQAYLDRRYREALDEVPQLTGESEEDKRIREIFYLTLTRWLPTLLDRKDRMSMAVGLEVRVPFCDHRLVEYVWNIPWELKNIGGQEKGILRRAMEGLLPNDVLYRKKSAYPMTQNPSYARAMRQRMLEVVMNPQSPILELINAKKVHAIIHNPTEDSSSYNGPTYLFAYLCQINEWMKEYNVIIH